MPSAPPKTGQVRYAGRSARVAANKVHTKNRDRAARMCETEFYREWSPWDACSVMRDAQVIEEELMEISAIADDTVKFERIIAWCASHPDEVPLALHTFLGRGRTD